MLLGSLGVLAALALLIVLALRGVSIIAAAILAALLVGLTNGMSLADALMEQFAGGMMRFAATYFLLFVTGALLGQVMHESGAAAAIAMALARRLGANRLLWVTLLATSLLTYGGVNVFVIVFTVYPLALGLMQQSNLPKRLFLGAFMLGAATFPMTALPGTPSVANNIAAQALGTPLSAGAVLGIIASGIMLAMGMGYLEWARKRAVRRGEGFVPAPGEGSAPPKLGALPPALLAIAPLALVLLTILLPQLALRAVGAPPATGWYGPLLHFYSGEVLFWTSIALAAGSCAGFLLLRRWLERPTSTLSAGVERSVLPLFNTASVIGFGAVVKETPIFDAFAGFMVSSDLPPLLSMLIATNVFAGIVGSASGGIGIFFTTLYGAYESAGMPPEVVHRLVTIASGGIDSLPHSGALITMFTVMRISHRDGYGTAFVATVLTPLMALVVVTALAYVWY